MWLIQQYLLIFLQVMFSIMFDSYNTIACMCNFFHDKIVFLLNVDPRGTLGMLKAPLLFPQTYNSRYYNVIVRPMMTISVRYSKSQDL